MDALWVIFVIIVIVSKILNKGGQVTGEMKERLPEILREKRLPPDLKDWGFPWDDEDNEWNEDHQYYTEATEKEDKSRKNTEQNTISGTIFNNSMETAADATNHTDVGTIVDNQTGLQQEAEAPGFEKHPLMDSASLVNGLILSELLQPPKSKRFGRRF